MKFLSFLAGFDTIEEGMYTCSKQVADTLMTKSFRLWLKLGWSTSGHFEEIFSYASSSTLYPRQQVSES